MENQVSRRRLLKTLVGIGASALAVGLPVAAEAAPSKPPDEPQKEVGVEMGRIYEQLLQAWEAKRPEFDGARFSPLVAPYLPATQAKTDALFNDPAIAETASYYATYPRFFIHTEEGSRAEYKRLEAATKEFGQKRGWGDFVNVYQENGKSVWGYSLMVMGNVADLEANKQVKVSSGVNSDGSTNFVDIDPMRLDNDTFARSFVGSRNMTSYMVPQDGAHYARLNLGQTEGEIAMGFAVNQHHIDVATAGQNEQAIPAVHFEGTAGAWVNVYRGIPTDGNGNFEMQAIKARLEPTRGHLTVYLPTESELYKDDMAPFIIAHMPVISLPEQGESQIRMVTSVGDKMPVDKNVVTNDMWATAPKVFVPAA